MRNHDSFVGLFFGPLPNLEELVSVKARIRTEQNERLSAIQPLCCRELIFTEPKVLVSPLPEERHELFVITPKEVYDSSHFRQLLEKLNIQITEPVELTKTLFQYCFSFTLRQRIAPLWNKAGEFLVQGRDFLEEYSKLNAVALELTVTDRICMALRAYNIKSPPSKPEHFSAASEALRNFHSSPYAIISESSISDDLCFVLPSLKRGRISSITRQLPEGSLFENYEDLRKHWKLMYGYRLPTAENVFYNVRFYYIKERVFTYPASCIRSAEVIVSPRCDHAAIFNSFLKDLSTRLPSVCGTPVVLTSSPLYPTNRLQQATYGTHSNLTRSEPDLIHCRPFSSVYKPVQFNTISHKRSATSLTSLPVLTQAPANHEPQASSGRVVNQPDIKLKNSSISSEGGISGRESQPLTLGPRIVPIFTSKTRDRFRKEAERTRSNTALKGSTTEKIPVPKVPTFFRSVSGAKRVDSPLPSSSQSYILDQETTEKIVDRNGVNQERVVEVGPNVNSVHHGASTEVIPQGLDLQSNDALGLDGATHNVPTRAFGQTNTRSPRGVTLSLPVAKRLPQTRPGLVKLQARSIARCRPSDQSISNGAVGLKEAISRPTEMQCHSMSNSGMTYREAGTEVNCYPLELPVYFTGITGANCEMARKRQNRICSLEESPHKRPKSKSKIQENIDLNQLAMKDQLHKVNTVTLTDWLKKRGVAVKSRDKKGELTYKVKQFLGLNLHEP